MRHFFIFSVLLGLALPAHAKDALCSALLTAHVEESIEVPPFWREIEIRLRKKIRTGWIKKGIPIEVAETLIEHLQKMRQAALVFARNHPEINAERAATMGLMHDVSEAIAPDFTPLAKITKAEKFALEKQAWVEIVRNVGPEAEPLMEIWLEYEEGKTPEAKLLKQLDKLDVVVQAHAYEKLGYTGLFEFFPVVRGYLTDPAFIRIYDVLMERKFPEVRVFDQYLFLLSVDADLPAFEKEMTARVEAIRAIEKEAQRL